MSSRGSRNLEREMRYCALSRINAFLGSHYEEDEILSVMSTERRRA